MGISLDFNGKFQRFLICSISETIGINRSISSSLGANGHAAPVEKRPSAVGQRSIG
jgi:hypothetical protein